MEPLSAVGAFFACSTGVESYDKETISDLEHWRSREVSLIKSKQARPQSSEVTAAMRTTLVDWLGEVRDEFRLHSETLFLTVTYLDSYLAEKSVPRSRFQLLGLACVWVAAKFEEVVSPPANAMLAMAENLYTAADLTSMEKEVLFTLDFGMAVPTALRFLHYLLRLAPLPANPVAATSARRLAESLLELTLLDTAFLTAKPSQLAAAAVYLSLGLLGHCAALEEFVELTGMEPHALGVLVKRLYQVLQEISSQPHPCAMLLRFRAWEKLHGGLSGGGGRGAVPAAIHAAARTTAAGGANTSTRPPLVCTTPTRRSPPSVPASVSMACSESLSSSSFSPGQEQQSREGYTGYCYGHKEVSSLSSSAAAAAAAAAAAGRAAERPLPLCVEFAPQRPPRPQLDPLAVAAQTCRSPRPPIPAIFQQQQQQPALEEQQVVVERRLEFQSEVSIS
ncbi:hypothetical protein VOLCADRAFT_127293 [Volvox carteri f. nagariensis]|uniref:Uncharacterized protein cycab1 n=1 Tax=Volvox carteri f. nagariensis TaxID=3068 RepID=D8TU32_VOLCA|nr:uncharacterized protein VOLCADRAFT_127293 [Volvox carteri f. nagariensis]EFJ49072.1 hypothetical protein VOLCADRAFT_127293 [Volvox carteri f. nagariensis]|eukprot:XP_002949969.1 hypothetical protein VOLCADRAFT_127293 [Volvox carteri f. nagariensis]